MRWGKWVCNFLFAPYFLNHWMDWAEIWLVGHYLFSFRRTAAPLIELKFFLANTPQPFKELYWNFSMISLCTICLVFLELLLNSWTKWTQNLLLQLLLICSMDLGDISRVFLRSLIVLYFFSYYRTALNSNHFLIVGSLIWSKNEAVRMIL